MSYLPTFRAPLRRAFQLFLLITALFAVPSAVKLVRGSSPLASLIPQCHADSNACWIASPTDWPRGVAVGGGKVFVSHGDSVIIDVYDETTFTWESSITASDSSSYPQIIGLADDGAGTLYAVGDMNSVFVIDTATKTVTRTITIPSGAVPYSVALSGTGVFVVNREQDQVENSPFYGMYTVSIIDTTHATAVERTIGLADADTPDSIVVAGTTMFIGSGGNNSLLVLDTRTGANVASPVALGRAVNEMVRSGTGIFVIGGGDHSISVVDMAHPTSVERTIATRDTIFGIAAKADGTIYAATYYGVVDAINPQTGQNIGTAYAAQRPENMTFHGDILYVVASDSSTLNILDTSGGDVPINPTACGVTCTTTSDCASYGSGLFCPSGEAAVCSRKYCQSNEDCTDDWNNMYCDTGHSLCAPLPACNTTDDCPESTVCNAGTCSYCGNGVTEGGEDCDDGNVVNGDGCNTQCKIESGNLCLNPWDVASVCSCQLGASNERQYNAFAAADGKMYVAAMDWNDSLGKVYILDVATDTFESNTITVGAFPTSIALDIAHQRAYVVNEWDNTVSVINTATNEIIGDPISVSQSQYIGITPDGRRAYTTNGESSVINILDLTVSPPTATLVENSSGCPGAMGFFGTKVYFANECNDSIDVLDTGTDQLVDTISLPYEPQNIAVAPDGNTAYVVDNTRDIRVVDLGQKTVEETPLVDLSDRDGWTARFALSQDGSKLYMPVSHQIVSIDTHARTFTTFDGSTVVAPYNEWYQTQNVAFTADGLKAYAAEATEGPSFISVINAQTDALVPQVCSVGDSSLSSSSSSTSSSSSLSSSSSSSSDSVRPSGGGGIRGEGTTTIYNPEYHVTVPVMHGAASSSASGTPSQGSSGGSSYQVVVPQVTVHALGGGVQLTEGTAVDVIRFLRAGRVAKIRLSNGKTGFVFTQSIGKK